MHDNLPDKICDHGWLQHPGLRAFSQQSGHWGGDVCEESESRQEVYARQLKKSSHVISCGCLARILHSLFHLWAYESFNVIAKSLELRGCMNVDNRLRTKRVGLAA